MGIITLYKYYNNALNPPLSKLSKKVHGKVIQELNFGQRKNVHFSKRAKDFWKKLFLLHN
jgi:hypothetical protein